MIPRMLTRDIEILERDYPEACRHIRAGQLRYEYFTLLCQDKPNTWMQSRKKELEKAPAIQEYAFQRSIERYQAIKK